MQPPTTAVELNVEAPTSAVLSTMLAGGDHAAGIFLAKLVKDTSKEGWCVIDRSLWMQACCFTSNQLDEVIARLIATGLVEGWKYLSGDPDFLLLTPAQKTMSYLASATTWELAQKLLSDPTSANQKKAPARGKPKSAKSVN